MNVVCGSQNDSSFSVTDSTSPAMPSNKVVPAPFGGGCTVDCDGTFAAIGNTLGGDVAIYDISTPSSPVVKGMTSTVLAGVSALSIDGAHSGLPVVMFLL
jgi:hypothetical protein